MVFEPISHCQQSVLGIVELDLALRIIGIRWELINVVCSIAGTDFIVVQEQPIRNDEAAAIFLKMLTDWIVNKPA